MSEKIICGACASYPTCKRKNKNHAIKCSGFWEHRPTSEFVKNIK